MLKKPTDVIILFTCVFALAMLIAVYSYSMLYWTQTYETTTSTEARMFWIGLLTAITYGVMGFMQDFIRAFAKSYNNLFKRRKA